MEHIIDEGGKTLLDILVVGLLITYLFATVKDGAGNQGILNIIGAMIQNSDTDYSSYSDFESYKVESRKEAPLFSCDTLGILRTGTYKISDYVRAEDYNGREIPVILQKVWGPGNEEWDAYYDSSTMQVNFVQPGTYTLEVYAVDDINKSTVCRITIPVNR